MKLVKYLNHEVSSTHLDAQLGQLIAWVSSALVMVGGTIRLTKLELTEPEFFIGLFLVTTSSLLGLMIGILIPIATKFSQQSE